MRRIVLALFLALTFDASCAEAQQAANVPRIGFLGLTSAATYGKQMEALRAGLRDQGYVEGKNVVIEYRWAEGKYDRLPDLASELVRLRVNVLVTHGTPPPAWNTRRRARPAPRGSARRGTRRGGRRGRR